jgi:DNA-binding transcriptional LysR family regulator
MDIRQLRQILAIHEHGSIAKAAQALGVAQPSLSTSIARFEDELKLRIFERTAKGSELTPAGRAIVERAERVIAEMRSLTRDVELMAGGEAGQLRLGIGSALRGNLLTDLLLILVRRHPNLRLHLDVGEGDSLLPKLETRELDLVMCAARPSAAKPTLVTTKLFTDSKVAVASPTHPLVAEQGLTLSRLGEFKCTITSSRSFALHGDNGERNLSYYTTTDYPAILPLVDAGLTVLVANALAVKSEISSGRLVVLDVIDLGPPVDFVAVATSAASYAPVVAKVVSYARAIGASIQTDGRLPASAAE